MQTQRNEKIDFYKGLLMFGVIWGHTITTLRAGQGTPIWFLTFMRTYDMPFFMVLSGFFMGKSMLKKPIKQVVLDRIGMVLIPLLTWNTLIGLSGPFFQTPRTIFSFWFLWSLLLCIGLTLMIFGGIFNQKIAWGCMGAVILVLHLIPVNPFNLGYMLPFFCMGYSMNFLKKPEWIWKEWTKIAVLVLFVLMECFWDGRYNVWNVGTNFLRNPATDIPAILFRGAIGIVGCLAAKLIFDMFYTSLQGTAVNRLIVATGKETLLLYILHDQAIIRVLGAVMRRLTNHLGYNPLTLQMRFLGYFLAPAVAILCIIVLLYGIRLLQKLPLRYNPLLGFRLPRQS